MAVGRGIQAFEVAVEFFDPPDDQRLLGVADVSVVAAEDHDGVLGHVLQGFDQSSDGHSVGSLVRRRFVCGSWFGSFAFLGKRIVEGWFHSA